MAAVSYNMITAYCQTDKNNYFYRCCDSLSQSLQIHQKAGGSSLY